MNVNVNVSYSPDISPSMQAQQSNASMGDLAAAGAYKYGTALVNALNDHISQRTDIPEAKKEQISEAMSQALQRTGLNTSAEALDLMEFVSDMIERFAEETVKEATGTADEKASGNGGAKNWLVALAKAMGQVAGKHLENMVNLSNEIAALKGGGEEGNAAQAKMMAELTAEMQAEGQMFKMAQEMATTVVKNVGEALHSTARKQ